MLMYHLCKWVSSLSRWWTQSRAIQWRCKICLLFVNISIIQVSQSPVLMIRREPRLMPRAPGRNQKLIMRMTQSRRHSEPPDSQTHFTIIELSTLWSSRPLPWRAINKEANKHKTLIPLNSPHTGWWNLMLLPFHFQNICGRNLLVNCKTIWRFKK